MVIKTKLTLSGWFAVIVGVTLIRLFTSPLMGSFPNFTPMLSLALFASVLVGYNRNAFLLPLFAILVSDFIVMLFYYGALSFIYPGFYWQYISYMTLVVLGAVLLKRLSLLPVCVTAVLGSFLFYVVSNFGVWLTGVMYPMTMEGLMLCYIAALPFYKNMLFSTVFYSLIIYTALLYLNRSPSLLMQSR